MNLHHAVMQHFVSHTMYFMMQLMKEKQFLHLDVVPKAIFLSLMIYSSSYIDLTSCLFFNICKEMNGAVNGNVIGV